MAREAQLDLPLLFGSAPGARPAAARSTQATSPRALPTWHPSMSVVDALQLEAAAERGDWEVMKRIDPQLADGSCPAGKQRRTCDLKLCAAHRWPVPGKVYTDLCPAHRRWAEQNQQKSSQPTTGGRRYAH